MWDIEKKYSRSVTWNYIEGEKGGPKNDTLHKCTFAISKTSYMYKLLAQREEFYFSLAIPLRKMKITH